MKEVELKIGDLVQTTTDSDSFANCSERRKGYKFIIRQINGEWYREHVGVFKGVQACDLKLIKRNKKNMKKDKPNKKKAVWKVGDVVENDNQLQKSKILEVHYDPQRDHFMYLVECLDDSGSLHFEAEQDLTEIERISLTISELKEYYEEENNCEVTIKK